MAQTKTSRNQCIDLFRFVCSIMVVAIHTQPLSELGDTAVFLTTQVIPRIAVPYFFAASGYFYTKKLQTSAPILPYLCKLLLTYTIWSVPYYAVDFLKWGYKAPLSFVIDCAISFFIYGSSYHFWFFPALFFSITLTTILWKCSRQKLLIALSLAAYALGCLGCSYQNLSIHIPILQNLYLSDHFTLIRRVVLMGFPFFVSGYLVQIVSDRMSRSDRHISITKGLMFFFSLWIIEIYIVTSANLADNIVITPMLYPLVITTLMYLLQNPFPISHNTGYRCRSSANFMYYAHPLFIMALNPFQMSETTLFVLTVALTACIGNILSTKNGRIIPYLIG